MLHRRAMEYVGQAKSDLVKAYVQRLADRTQKSIDYEDGKWVDLTFDPTFSDWSGSWNIWEFDDEHTARVKVIPGISIALMHKTIFRGPKEIELTMREISLTQPASKVGVQVGHVPTEAGDRNASYLLFYSAFKEQRIGLAIPNQDDLGRDELNKWWREPINHLRVRMWGPQFEIYVDGVLAISQSQADVDPADLPVGIGQQWLDRIEGEYEFSNMRIRKIDFPAPPENDIDAEIVYLTERIADDPEMFEFYRRRGQLLSWKGRTDEAIADLEKAIEIRAEFTPSHEVFAGILIGAGKYREGMKEEEILIEQTEHDPHWQGHVLATHAMTLATVPVDELRDGKRALELADRSLEKRTNDNSKNHLARACALAELGDFNAAQESLNIARNLNSANWMDSLIDEIEAAIKKQQPYRMKAPQ